MGKLRRPPEPPPSPALEPVSETLDAPPIAYHTNARGVGQSQNDVRTSPPTAPPTTPAPSTSLARRRAPWLSPPHHCLVLLLRRTT